MRYTHARTMLELDAIVHFAVGGMLILSSWNGLYRALELPRVDPALFAQLGGAAFIGFAWLLWVTPSVPELTRQVVAGAAVANAISALVVVGWLVGRWRTLTDTWHVGALGKVILAGLAVVFLGLAYAERLLFKRGFEPATAAVSEDEEPSPSASEPSA